MNSFSFKRHYFFSEPKKRDNILQDAEKRLKVLKQISLKNIASELVSPDDQFRYLRNYRPGLQEYVEASVFAEFLQNHRLLTLAEMNDHIASFCSENSECFLKITGVDYTLGLADVAGKFPSGN